MVPYRGVSFFCAGIILFVVAGSVGAVAISVNCADSSTPNRMLDPTENAGLAGYEAVYWNNILLGATGTELVNDGGLLADCVINFAVSNGWADGTADGTVDPPNDKIARSYFDDGVTSGNIGVDIEVTNVPFGAYIVVLYLST